MMQQMLQQFGAAPNFEELVENPNFRVLMQQFMQDPELLIDDLQKGGSLPNKLFDVGSPGQVNR